jgi:hypothetical protein
MHTIDRFAYGFSEKSTPRGIRQISAIAKIHPSNPINFQIAIMQSETMAAPAPVAVAPTPVFN